MKIPSKQELQQIATSQSFDIDFNDFKRLYRNFTGQPCSLIIVNATLS